MRKRRRLTLRVLFHEGDLVRVKASGQVVMVNKVGYHQVNTGGPVQEYYVYRVSTGIQYRADELELAKEST